MKKEMFYEFIYEMFSRGYLLKTPCNLLSDSSIKGYDTAYLYFYSAENNLITITVEYTHNESNKVFMFNDYSLCYDVNAAITLAECCYAEDIDLAVYHLNRIRETLQIVENKLADVFKKYHIKRCEWFEEDLILKERRGK